MRANSFQLHKLVSHETLIIYIGLHVIYSKYVQIFTRFKSEIGMDNNIFTTCRQIKKKHESLNKLHEWLQEIQLLLICLNKIWTYSNSSESNYFVYQTKECSILRHPYWKVCLPDYYTKMVEQECWKIEFLVPCGWISIEKVKIKFDER